MREENTKKKCLDGKRRISATGAKQDVKLAQFTYFRVSLSLAAAIQGLYFVLCLVYVVKVHACCTKKRPTAVLSAAPPNRAKRGCALFRKLNMNNVYWLLQRMR